MANSFYGPEACLSGGPGACNKNLIRAFLHCSRVLSPKPVGHKIASLPCNHQCTQAALVGLGSTGLLIQERRRRQTIQDTERAVEEVKPGSSSRKSELMKFFPEIHTGWQSSHTTCRKENQLCKCKGFYFGF